MARKTYFIVLFFLLIFLESYLCFNVNLLHDYDIKMEPTTKHISKRDVFQKLDKASYSFNGFQKNLSVPVIFPLDICLMDVEGVTYATALHINKNGVRHFSVYKNINGRYRLIAAISSPLAITIDCRSFGDKGYVALAHNITGPIKNQKEGSTIYEITSDSIRPIQYFSTPNITDILLLIALDGLYMLQILKNTALLPNLECPYFLWQGVSFQLLGSIPCTNAQHLETFSIDNEIYVAVPNYSDKYGRTEIDSEIYKYDSQKQGFKLFQRIGTNGAVHAKYFQVPFGDDKKHFLIFGNSVSSNNSTLNQSNTAQGVTQNLEADSIIYRFKKGQFEPYQKLTFYDVDQFLPIENSVTEKFLLLVGCRNQDIKIFNLHDWTFEESDIQYTGGAFGNQHGVINLRVYKNQGNSYLVVANRNMFANNTNIFLPIFKQDEDANLLRKEIIEWSKKNTERLESIDVDRLRREVERKMATYRKQMKSINITEISRADIKHVTTKSLIYPPLQIGRGYWKSLSYAKQALDVLETKLQQGAIRHKRDLQKSPEIETKNLNEYNFERLHGRTLIVRDNVKARKINGFDVNLGELEHITAKKVIVSGKYEMSSKDDKGNYFPQALTMEEDAERMQNEDTLNVDNLKIINKLNEFTWDDLVNNTLKRRGSVQFFKAPVSFENLTVDAVTVTSNEIGGQNLAKLVSIDGGSYVVNQDLKFDAPVKAKNVIIHERLNNIHVYKNRLDVLLRNSNETQIILGTKHFDNLKVMKPIKVSGRALESSITVEDSLTLNGDYTIDGDVTISKTLTTHDIIEANTKISTKLILNNGIRMDEPLENMNIALDHPIVANNSIVSFINTYDLQQLVRTNTDDVQVIEGEKHFKGNLEIETGFGEVKILNGINVEELEKRLFLRDANQTITVPMHFGKIMMKSVNSPQLTLNSQNLTDYLNLNGTQKIHGVLRVDELTTNTLIVQDLHTNGKIFDKPLAEIYQQKANSAPHPNIFQKGRKFRGSIYVRNLKLNSTINGKSVDQLKRQMRLLGGDIKYVGDLKFNYDMRISNLSFYGKFNGISAEEFGQCWLQKDGDQSFTAPQTISSLECDSGILLQGTLNGYRVEDFTTNTYWINRDEYITSAIFENPIELKGALFSSTVNNIYIPQDILYRSSAQPQILSYPITVKGNLLVQGQIRNATSFNGLNLLDLERYINGYGWDTLYVQNATFTYPPQYKTLNYHDLQQTLETVWLANENVNIRKHIEISDGHFEGLLELEGPINNVNLQYLKENYFSLTRPQTISADMVFSNLTKFDHDFYANDMRLFGPIIDSKSETHFPFDDFVLNTFKTSGPQTITAKWSIPEVKVLGDLNNVLINNLNLATDVVRRDVALSVITAPKRIDAATIKKLYVTPSTQVNKVNVSDWIRDTVFVYENHTIRGTTVLDTVNIYNDLQVDGRVNNVVFDEHTLLLRERNQVLRGPVLIRNKFPAEQRILTNNIENLWTDTVNGWSVSEFYANKAKLAPEADVRGSLVFVNPLHVSEYRSVDSRMYEEATQRGKRGVARVSGHDYKSTATLSDLERTVQALRHSYASKYYILEGFEVRQTLKVNATKLVSLKFRLKEDDLIDVISVVLNNSPEMPLRFYTWNTAAQQFVSNQNFSWMAKDQLELNILNLSLKKADNLLMDQATTDTQNQNHRYIIANHTESLKAILNMTTRKYNGIINDLKIKDEDCFAIYSNESAEVSLYCLSKSKKITLYSTINASDKVKQVLTLPTKDMMAILCANVVEIWNTRSLQPVQRIAAAIRPKQMAVISKDKIVFLALMSASNENSLHHGSVEIYRSINNSTYKHLQTIDSIRPLQIEFEVIPRSADLLLYILCDSYAQPMTVHQYKGVAGWVQIVADSILPKAFQMSVIHLTAKQQHLIALISDGQITFVEVVLKKV